MSQTGQQSSYLLEKLFRLAVTLNKDFSSGQDLFQQHQTTERETPNSVMYSDKLWTHSSLVLKVSIALVLDHRHVAVSTAGQLSASHVKTPHSNFMVFVSKLSCPAAPKHHTILLVHVVKSARRIKKTLRCALIVREIKLFQL